MGLVEPVVRTSPPWHSLSGLMLGAPVVAEAAIVMYLWYVAHVSLSVETAPGGEATRVCGWRK